nr:RNA-directed DNA polymerase, eukaryota, reverse transcriptase zinc-binding domain protein [Tanacetum cinerariifolium]
MADVASSSGMKKNSHVANYNETKIVTPNLFDVLNMVEKDDVGDTPSDTICSKCDMANVNVENNKDVNMDNEDIEKDVVEDINKTISFLVPKLPKVTSYSMSGGVHVDHDDGGRSIYRIQFDWEYRSKENEVRKLSTSIFVTNFPEKCSTKELWNACKQYGTIVDTFIPDRRSKLGKRFGFVCFIKIYDVERLVNNLCTIWIGSFKLHANIARFQRSHPQKNNSQSMKGTKGEIKAPKEVHKGNGVNGYSQSYARVVNLGSQTFHKNEEVSAIVLDDSCINVTQYDTALMGEVKDFTSLSTLKKILTVEGFESIKIKYMGGFWVMMEFDTETAKEKFKTNVGIPLKVWSKNTFMRITSKWGELLYYDELEEGYLHSKRIRVRTKFTENIFESFKIILKEKVFWIRAKEVSGWVPDFDEDEEEEGDSRSDDEVSKEDAFKENVNLDGTSDIEEVAETIFKKEQTCTNRKENGDDIQKGASSEDRFDIYDLLNKKRRKQKYAHNVSPSDREGGKYSFHGQEDKVDLDAKKTSSSTCLCHFQKCELPRSGGSILQIMEELIKVGQTIGYNMEGCLAQKTKKDWVRELCDKHKDLREKKMLWDYFIFVLNSWNDDVVIMGDFNEVHNHEERYGSMFNIQGADAFNAFISTTSLEDVPLAGCKFTWCHKTASKMSKLDRFLVSEGLMNSCPNISAITLDRYLSDHRPILLRESHFDYGPTPFRLYHYWFELDGFDNFVKQTWKEAQVIDLNAIQGLKDELAILDVLLDRGEGNVDILNKRTNVFKSLQDLDKLDSLEVAQKTKIKWAIEGDENLKYFYEVLNKKKNQLAIRGILVEGCWIEDPTLVKSEFFTHFARRFDIPTQDRLYIEMDFPNILSMDQQMDLKNNITQSEIKKVVWDCGVDKSPGSDGFSFGFYRKYCLHISVQRVVNAGMFKGIQLGSSFQVSHLFYADDAVFIGNWSDTNIDTIIRVLECFHKAYGLRINLSKSKLLGISVSNAQLEQAANKIGCATLEVPFLYLGSKVGCLMSRSQSWNEIVNSISARLSTWKMKTLSIGGRLTLLKSVLGSLPVYHMSLFKVPQKVLHVMEAIRRNFFNGIDHKGKKQAWISWNKVLASKDNGGLGISSFFALNRALLFKWVWRFWSHPKSLWTKVIKEIHGDDGKLDMLVKNHSPSLWLDIISEVQLLKTKGIDLMGFMLKKMGNGEDTLFWDHVWRGERTFKSASRSGVEEDQYIQLVKDMDGVFLIVRKDKWSWSLAGNGDFSVASIRKELDNRLLPLVLIKTRWIRVVPIKINIHAWKVKLDSLPTRLNISKRGIVIDSILCPICNMEVESSGHLFFTCLLARDLFEKTLAWWDINVSEGFINVVVVERMDADLWDNVLNPEE